MKATFVSETTEHVILSLDVTRQELLACAKGDDGAVQELMDEILATCRKAGVVADPLLDEAERASSALAAELPHPPFRAEHYKGVPIQRIYGDEHESSPEELMKERLLDAVIERNTIYIPQEQIDSETDNEFAGRRQTLKYQGLMAGALSLYQAYGTEEDRNEVERDVIRQLKAERILESIIEQEGITVTQEELEERAEAIAERDRIGLDMVRRFFGEDYSLLQGEVLKEKAVQLIFDNATILD